MLVSSSLSPSELFYSLVCNFQCFAQSRNSHTEFPSPSGAPVESLSRLEHHFQDVFIPSLCPPPNTCSRARSQTHGPWVEAKEPGGTSATEGPRAHSYPPPPPLMPLPPLSRVSRFRTRFSKESQEPFQRRQRMDQTTSRGGNNSLCLFGSKKVVNHQRGRRSHIRAGGGIHITPVAHTNPFSVPLRVFFLFLIVIPRQWP